MLNEVYFPFKLCIYKLMPLLSNFLNMTNVAYEVTIMPIQIHNLCATKNTSNVGSIIAINIAKSNLPSNK